MVKYTYQKVATVVALFLNVGLVLLSLSSVAEGQVCNMSPEGLKACRPAATPPHPTKPTAKCCSALWHANLACLCRYKHSSILPALGVDPKLAIKVLRKCRLPHPAPC